MQGLVSFNRIISSQLLKSRLTDTIPVELQELIDIKAKQKVSNKGLLRKLGHQRNLSQETAEKFESQFKDILDNWEVISSDRRVVQQEVAYLISLLKNVVRERQEVKTATIKEVVLFCEQHSAEYDILKKL